MRRKWRSGKWETPSVEPDRRESGFGRLWAFLGGGRDEPPDHPRRHQFIDEGGSEIEVYAPPGRVMHFDEWP